MEKYPTYFIVFSPSTEKVLSLSILCLSNMSKGGSMNEPIVQLDNI